MMLHSRTIVIHRPKQDGKVELHVIARDPENLEEVLQEAIAEISYEFRKEYGLPQIGIIGTVIDFWSDPDSDLSYEFPAAVDLALFLSRKLQEQGYDVAMPHKDLSPVLWFG